MSQLLVMLSVLPLRAPLDNELTYLLRLVTQVQFTELLTYDTKISGRDNLNLLLPNDRLIMVCMANSQLRLMPRRTVGVSVTVRMVDGTIVRVQLWSTQGQSGCNSQQKRCVNTFHVLQQQSVFPQFLWAFVAGAACINLSP